MYQLRTTKQFRKSYKKMQSNRKFKKEIFDFVVLELQNKKELDDKFQDHELKGRLSGQRECHLSPDLLLTYEYRDDILVLLLINIGSHSDLF